MKKVTSKRIQYTNSYAIFSPCKAYRYTLTRVWDAGCGTLAFIGLNPSTADEIKNDPTVSRCVNYAYDWGFSSMTMLNLFAYRATDPNVMKKQEDPVGADNDRHILEEVQKADCTVLGWGNCGAYRGRSKHILSLLEYRPLYCLGITSEREPSHPLYLRRDLRPVLLEDCT